MKFNNIKSLVLSALLSVAIVIVAGLMSIALIYLGVKVQ